ncbi:MAG TPA: SpoIIE family protein phosphatase [Solirubrobacteraceae bacterium]|nr:SpoIIE family protein phosphatase [Solirubrobacteraceae bacterium]
MSRGSPLSFDPLRVLLVEDDDGDAMLVEDYLAEALPHAGITRGRTVEGALGALDGGMDCVLLDLNLPDAGGLEAVLRLRERAPEIALIVLTGLDDEAAGVAAVEAGAQDYLVKGAVDAARLGRAVRYAIVRRQADAAQQQLRIAEVQSREIARLERGLAPPPLVEDQSVWVASRYRAGRRQALLGGDFYDVVETPAGTLRVVVGDVCGNGPDEAAIGVSLRTTWRALALAGANTELALATLERVLGHESKAPSMFATACVVEVDSERTGAQVTVAGHPRPVLIDGSRSKPLFSARPGLPVGLAEGRWVAQRAGLPAGWALLLYSDGLIEGRIGRGPERLGEDALHVMLDGYLAVHPEWHERPEELLDWLIVRVEELNGDALTDDVALLLVGARDG